jgi:hypothetical protein
LNPQTVVGEHLVIEGDGLGYYAWLRSALIDGDWEFDNEFDEHNPYANWTPTERTDLGFRANYHSVGPALLWAPAVCLVHSGRALGVGEQWPGDGYSLPYQLAVGFTAMLVAALTLTCLYGICRLYARPALAALATAFLILGTMLVNYSAVMVTWGHGSGAAVSALLIWYWLKSYGSVGSARWFALGSLVGLAALMRWQLAVLALLPVGEFVSFAVNRQCSEKRRELRSLFAKLVLAGFAAFVVFLPQLIAWKAVYGHWFVTPQRLAHHWMRPDFYKVLFDSDRSFFYWTPITALALLGLMVGVARRRPPRHAVLCGRREPLAILLGAFTIQVYFIACVIGDGVFLGSAFGFRFLTESVVVLAPGLAILLESASNRNRRWLIAGCFLLTIWNAILLGQFHFKILPKDSGAELHTLLSNVPRLIERGVQYLIFLGGPGLLGAALFVRRLSLRHSIVSGTALAGRHIIE